MKSYTDLEQSKKLAEFLPLKSADGFWEYHDKWYSEGDEWEGYEDYPRAEPYLEYTRKENEWKEDKSDIPCWSLTALLKVIPFWYDIHPVKNGVAIKCDYGKEEIVISDNHIDACVEMIIKLNKLKML